MSQPIVDKYSTNLSTLDFANIFVNKIGHMADQPYQFFTNSFVRHDYCIQYVVKGQGEFFANNQLFKINKNTLFLLPKQNYHYYKADKEDPYEYYWIHFNGDGFSRFLESISLTEETPVLYDIDNPQIEIIFKELLDLSVAPNMHDTLLILSKGYRLLYEIASTLPSKQSLPKEFGNETVERIVNFIAENYSKNINLETLSELVHINKCYLITLFKKVTGVSPIRYLIQYRIANACKLLREDYTITEISRRCGFEDLTNFLIRFKQLIGMSPSMYRKSLKTEQ